MYKKSYYLVCFALAMVLAGVAQGVTLVPDDSSVKDNLCLWLRSPDVNFDPAPVYGPMSVAKAKTPKQWALLMPGVLLT